MKNFLKLKKKSFNKAIKNKKWINNTIRNHNFYWDANRKYIRYCFANFYNINIKEIEFDDNYLYIRFKESYYMYEYIGNSIGAEVKGKLIHIVYDDRIGKYMPKIINNNVNIEYLQGYLLKNKLSNINSKGCGFVDKYLQPLYFNNFGVKNTVDKSVTNS